MSKMTKKQLNEILNALWFKFAAYHISISANNKLTHISYNDLGASFGDSIEIDNMVKMCNDLVANNLVGNNRSRLPHYLGLMDIENSTDLKNWLDYLKDEEIFSDKEVEILLIDYKSLAGEPGNQKSHK